MSLNLYFFRHGQTTLSRADVFCGSGLDPELTPEGAEMAQAFADAYRRESWSAIYCSNLRRAISSAQPLCAALGMDLQVDPDLGEIAYGEWEGLTKEQAGREYHDDYINWLADPARHAPTGGELATTVAKRSAAVIANIKQLFPAGNVLVVSHKATIRISICELLGIEVGRFRYRLACPVGSISKLEFSREGPMLHSLADRSHLSERLRSLAGT